MTAEAKIYKCTESFQLDVLGDGGEETGGTDEVELGSLWELTETDLITFCEGGVRLIRIIDEKQTGGWLEIDNETFKSYFESIN